MIYVGLVSVISGLMHVCIYITGLVFGFGKIVYNPCNQYILWLMRNNPCNQDILWLMRNNRKWSLDSQLFIKYQRFFCLIYSIFFSNPSVFLIFWFISTNYLLNRTLSSVLIGIENSESSPISFVWNQTLSYLNRYSTMAKQRRKLRILTVSPNFAGSTVKERAGSSTPIEHEIAVTQYPRFLTNRGISRSISTRMGSYNNTHSPYFWHSAYQPRLCIVTHILDRTHYNN